VIRGVLHKRPAIDLVRAQDVGLDGVPDPEVLAWAAQEGRIVLSRDKSTMRGDTEARVAAGLAMPGLFLLRRASVRDLIEAVLLVDSCSETWEWQDRVEWLPL
jgi:hypothetical protein